MLATFLYVLYFQHNDGLNDERRPRNTTYDQKVKKKKDVFRLLVSSSDVFYRLTLHVSRGNVHAARPAAQWATASG